jgi:DNA-binding transcriptional regulator YiaG
VQEKLALNITAGQDWCAAALHTSRRAWQQWETGDREMHDAFFELISLKVDQLTGTLNQGLSP